MPDFCAVDAVLEQAQDRWFTGAVARIEHRGALLYERALGRTRNDGLAQPVYVDTPFDLASITKLFVSTLALRQAASGAVDLDEPLVRWIPEWQNTPHAPITMRMLLAHTSGMNSGADYRTLFDLDVARFAMTRPLIAAPGERVIYSDLGMIALGVTVERIARRALATLIADATQRARVQFNPPQSMRHTIPATEDDGWRGRVQGVVHDEKAFLMNGVAGHAGLFGAAADVAWLGDAYLAASVGRAQSLLPAELAREAIHEAAYDPVLRRGLGWALKTNDDNSCGRRMSMETFGHTGFTGTCVWADPQRDLCAVLLTNSVYFGRNDSRPLRAAFFEAAVEAVDRC
ncbi:MAG TPA: serine hydrolase domain-containing protein [Candidatus Aquilonibacter sp.]|nr:serine hydrolase domain-containing protein [Candidatus Aquilonibacter sp.]